MYPPLVLFLCILICVFWGGYLLTENPQIPTTPGDKHRIENQKENVSS